MQKFEEEYHEKNEKITLYKCAIGSYDGVTKFYDSEGDAISTTSLQHKEKWEAGYNVQYKEIDVPIVSVDTFLRRINWVEIDFLNLDVESTNIELFNLFPDSFWQRLKMICIEHDNQIDHIKSKLERFGFTEITRNGENLILAKK